jgi:hypothetical protein
MRFFTRQGANFLPGRYFPDENTWKSRAPIRTVLPFLGPIWGFSPRRSFWGFDRENDTGDHTEQFLRSGDAPLSFTATNGRETQWVTD